MSKNLKLFILFLIILSIPLTIILVSQVQNYKKQAAEPIRKMALGISIPYGRASRDLNTDLAIAEIERFASPISNGGVGAYPASYSIWTDFDESGWKYGSRSKFPNQKLLTYLDSKKITPMIFMAPVGNGMTRSYGTLEQAKKFSNQSIADGSFDAYLIEWANAAKAFGKPVILRYAWEMNGNWFPWSPYNSNVNGKDYFDVGNTPENYVAAWRHVYDVIKPIAPNVKFFWCPIGVNGVSSYMERFYPGNNYVDYVGFDEYNSNPIRTENLTLSNAWDGSMRAIRHTVTGSETTLSTKPILIGETGLLVNNELRFDKLNYNTIYTTYPDIFGIIYFDVDVDYLFGVNAEPGRNWRLSGKSDNPNSTYQGVDLRPKYNTFVTQEKFQGKFNPEYENIQTPTNIPTAIPSNNPSPIPTLLNTSPIGYHDSSSCTVSSGWTCDPDSFSSSLEVNFYADGTSSTGTYLGKTSANLTREAAVGDMCGGNPNHGFSFNIPSSLMDGNSHTIYAYATNIGSGSNKLLNNSPKTITCQAPTKTPTPTSSPTKIPTPLPTSITSSQNTILRFSTVKLHGIGNGGDNSNPSAIGNTNPLTKTKNLKAEIYNSSGAFISQFQGQINYSNGAYSGDIMLDSSLPTDKYIVKIVSDKYLKRQISGIITITKGAITSIPTVDLIAGNSNNDNFINNLDYNILIDCYSDLLDPRNCSDPNKKAMADLTDDGNVNAADYNLFLRELSVVSGD